MLSRKRLLFIISITGILVLSLYGTEIKKWTSKSIKAQFSPEAIVFNSGSTPVFIIIDADPNHHTGAGVHTLVELPAYTSATDIGIEDPEGVLLPRDAFRDSAGVIHAKPDTFTLKTPAGSHVTVSGDTTEGIVFHSYTRGWLGHILSWSGITPALKTSDHFSDGRYKRPIATSPYRQAYDTLAQGLSLEHAP